MICANRHVLVSCPYSSDNIKESVSRCKLLIEHRSLHLQPSGAASAAVMQRWRDSAERGKPPKCLSWSGPEAPCVMKSVCCWSSALLNPNGFSKNCRLCKEWLWRTAAAPPRLLSLHQMRAINRCWTELESNTEQSGVFWWASNGSAACPAQLRWHCQIPLRRMWEWALFTQVLSLKADVVFENNNLTFSCIY